MSEMHNDLSDIILAQNLTNPFECILSIDWLQLPTNQRSNCRAHSIHTAR
jgi:hypothetical protein